MPTFFYYFFCILLTCVHFKIQNNFFFTISILRTIKIYSTWNLLLHFPIRLKAKFFSQAYNDQALPFLNVFPTSIPSTYSSHPDLLAVVFLYIILSYILLPLCRIQRCNNNLESVLIGNLPSTNNCGKSLN